MGIHLIDNDKVVKYTQKSVYRESEIEDFLESHTEILDGDIFVIGKQVEIPANRIDLMGLDRDGNVVIIEMKKGASPRKVISQILEYGVWAEDIQYEDLNRIAKEKHLSDYPNLYKKYEKEYKEVPEPFNQNQRLYIVAEKIDEKTEKICRYLRVRGIDINCVEINFYEHDGHKIVNTKTVVGTEETIYEELGDDTNSKRERKDWKTRMERASPENKKNVTDLISNISKTIDCRGKPRNSWYYFYAMKNSNKTKQFAAITCGKNTATIAFRVDPEIFDIDDQRIRKVRGWFFPSDSERRIYITSENIELILQCLKHAHEATLSL